MYKNLFATYNQVSAPDNIEFLPLTIQNDLEDITFPESLIKQKEETVSQETSSNPIVLTTKIVNKPTTAKPKKSYDHTISFEQLLKNIGANAKITSGYRPNSKTKQGRVSNHSKKDQWGHSMAFDVVPNDGNFNKLRLTLINSPEARNWFEKRGYGVLDETSKAMLAKTGGTGAHFHIGPDLLAKLTWKSWTA